MTTKIQSRRDVASNWTAINPILAIGEIGIEIDPGQPSAPAKFKIGNGVTTWNTLPYSPLVENPGISWGSITGTIGNQTDLQNALNLKSDTTHAHAGVYQPTSTVLTNTTASFTSAQETKLSGVETGATVNSPDAALLNRANHTGAQAQSTITGLTTDLAGKEPANTNIQAHILSAHAPANAQANADITKAEIEARLTGVIASHSHAGGGAATGVLSDLQFSILQSDGTLNAAAGVQTWAGTNKAGQDVFTLAANTTYRVRGQWYVNTGATTHTTAMAWALSGATVADFQYQVILWSAAANTIATTASRVHVTGVASKVLNATSTAVYTVIQFEGTLVTGAGGTITPQINFSANPTGVNLMKRGSWITFSKLGTDTVVVSNASWG